MNPKKVYNNLKKVYKNMQFIKFAKFNSAISTNQVINSNKCLIVQFKCLHAVVVIVCFMHAYFYMYGCIYSYKYMYMCI